MTGDRLAEYRAFHWAMYDAGDIDPAYAMLRYVAERFDLNPDQRYWLAFLYAMTYNGPTAYYMLSEFPDLELAEAGRLKRWWDGGGRAASAFQSDRRWIRSRNQFVPAVLSYQAVLGGLSQVDWWEHLRAPTPEQTYDRAMFVCGAVQHVGRFTLFSWLEAVHVLTGYPMRPSGLDLREAESSRNGLAYALGQDALLAGWQYGGQRIGPRDLALLASGYKGLMESLRAERPGERVDAWNVETTLCAFKKYQRGKRYVGYYLDRQASEIRAMQAQPAAAGVHWGVLWDYRAERLDRRLLVEHGARNAA